MNKELAHNEICSCFIPSILLILHPLNNCDVNDQVLEGKRLTISIQSVNIQQINAGQKNVIFLTKYWPYFDHAVVKLEFELIKPSMAILRKQL